MRLITGVESPSIEKVCYEEGMHQPSPRESRLTNGLLRRTTFGSNGWNFVQTHFGSKPRILKSS